MKRNRQESNNYNLINEQPPKKIQKRFHFETPNQIIIKKNKDKSNIPFNDNMCCIKGCKIISSIRRYSSLKGNWEIKEDRKISHMNMKICSNHYYCDIKKYPRNNNNKLNKKKKKKKKREKREKREKRVIINDYNSSNTNYIVLKCFNKNYGYKDNKGIKMIQRAVELIGTYPEMFSFLNLNIF